MGLFWKYVRRHWCRVAIAVTFIALTDLPQVLMPKQFEVALSVLGEPGATRADVARVALVIAGLIVAMSVFRMAWRLVMWPLARQVEYELRRDLFAHLQRLDPGYYHRHPSGDLISRASSDVDALRRFFSMGFAVFCDVLFVMPPALYMMLRMNWRLTLVVAGPILLAPIFSIVITRRLSRAFRGAQDSLGLLTARAQEDIAGTRILKTYARESVAAENYRAANHEVRGHFLVLARLWSYIGPYFHAVPQGATLLLMIAASTWALTGQCTRGEMVAFHVYTGLLSWPTFALGWGLAMLQRMRASLARVQEVLDEPRRQRALPASGPDEARGELSFRNLTFAYGGGRPVLEDLSLEVPAGQVLGVTGPTGGSKSTLLELAVALIEPPRGAVFLDGVDVRDIAPEKLRRHVAMVQQTPYLFSRSLAENLAFTRPEASAEEVREAVRISGMEPDLRQFEQGMDTLVGDRGITLSGGQRLRVALGRALVARPRVLLLDDAFSAVDVRTEEFVWNELRAATAGRTMVVVSHRASVLRRCDRIAVIEGGRVSELGTHEELLGGKGFYARTFALQELFEQ